ncbi:MAG: metalloregulator ArsR/SmtB family transcription factor [Deltaproteobacteria bacterium]|nr:metalloregulator ArsR/SmtB family transcription factor [Deltaproteobacteria bacterium]
MNPDELDTLVRFFKALADPSRLRILGLLAHGERSVGALAEALDLRDPTVSHHLTRLYELGLVSFRAEGTARFYRLETDALQRLKKDLFTVDNVASIADTVEAERWERKVLATYFEGERLTSIPTTRKKRNVILDHLARSFAPGERYPEARVNAVIRRHHDDTATLRRELIMTGLMARDGGVYWRTDKARAT